MAVTEPHSTYLQPPVCVEVGELRADFGFFSPKPFSQFFQALFARSDPILLLLVLSPSFTSWCLGGVGWRCAVPACEVLSSTAHPGASSPQHSSLGPP